MPWIESWTAEEARTRPDRWEHVCSESLPVEQLSSRAARAAKLDALAHVVRERVFRVWGFLVLRGFVGAESTPEGAEAALRDLGCRLGTPAPQSPDGALVGRLVDRPGSDWREEQPLHTDGGDVLALLCLRPAARGGLTRLTSARAAYERLAAQCPRSVALLEDEWRFSRKGRPGPPTLTKRIFEWVDGELHAFHLPGTVRWTPRVHGLPPLTPDAARALDDLDCVLNSAALRFELKLEAGDLLVLDNRVVLHARSAYEDDSSHGPRFLLRMWWTVDRRAIRGESHTRG